MAFNLLSFDDMISKLLVKQELEEHLHDIINNIEHEFKYQSIGIYLRVAKTDTYRMKISRNISHTFAKNSIYNTADPLLKELNTFHLLDLRAQDTQHKFEKDYSHLLILPLYYNEDLLGFMFIDKSSEVFDSEEITKVKLFASTISVIVQLYLNSGEIEKHRKKYGSSNIYAYEAFIDKSEEVFSLMKRYNRDLTIAVIQISNYDDLVRTIGKHEAEDILKQVSITLKKDIRTTDVIGKIRKNAFAVLLPETSSNNGFVTITRVSNKINKLPISKTCKISWGLAGLDDKTENVVDLLKLAEFVVNDSNRKDEDFIVIYR